MSNLGIVAALEREVWALVRHWSRRTIEFAGRDFEFYETGHASLVCGGIGPEPARRAAEALATVRRPSMLVSVGYAGGLLPDVRPGGIFGPHRVVDANTGESYETGIGAGTLVTTTRILDADAKAELRERHNAVAVDMEAAAVAAVAKRHGIPFLAVKAIYDAGSFSLPPLTQFIDLEGRFLTSKYVAYAALRPWKWILLLKMARISAVASATLCDWLRDFEQEAASEKAEAQAVGPA